MKKKEQDKIDIPLVDNFNDNEEEFIRDIAQQCGEINCNDLWESHTPPFHEKNEEINKMNRRKEKLVHIIPINRLKLLEQRIEKLEAMINKERSYFFIKDSEIRRQE